MNNLHALLLIAGALLLLHHIWSLVANKDDNNIQGFFNTQFLFIPIAVTSNTYFKTIRIFGIRVMVF